MTQPVFPLYTVQIVPPQCMSIRSRREASTRDTTNARHFELWQTDGKYGIQNRPDVNAQPVMFDFMPINSRFVGRDYRTMPRYDETGDKGGMNSYFDKYASSYDSRNFVREVQSAVYEDKDVEGLKQTRSFLTRSMDHRFISGEELGKMAEVAATMRPLRDDILQDYRKK